LGDDIGEHGVLLPSSYYFSAPLLVVDFRRSLVVVVVDDDVGRDGDEIRVGGGEGLGI
jgi:hypothetical protein